MTPSPDPEAAPAAVPVAMTYRRFINEFMQAVSTWGIGGFIEIVLSSMLGLWLGWLSERTEGWMAQAEAAEAAARKAAEAAEAAEAAGAEPEPAPKVSPKPAPEPKAERKARPSAAEAAPAEAQPASAEAEASTLEAWQVPPQWSLPLTWPKPRPEGPVTRRPFGWLAAIMNERGRPHRQNLQDLLETPAMATLFTHCPQAQTAWIPVCWMLGVSSDKVRYPGQPAPPRRLPPPRRKLSKLERWLRALARDPDPQPRYIQREKSGGGGWRGICQLRPKGSVFMDYDLIPHDFQRKA
jgi:hypothetical protein